MIKPEHWLHPGIDTSYQAPDRFQHERAQEILRDSPDVDTEHLAEMNPFIHPEVLLNTVDTAKDYRLIIFDGPNCPISLYTLDDKQEFKVALHLKELDDVYAAMYFPESWTLIQVTDPIDNGGRNLIVTKKDFLISLPEEHVGREISTHFPAGFNVFKDKLETLKSFPLDLFMLFLSGDGPTPLEGKMLDLSHKGNSEARDGYIS